MKIDLNNLEGTLDRIAVLTTPPDQVKIYEYGREQFMFERVRPCPYCDCEWYVWHDSTDGYLCGWDEDEYCPRYESGM